MLQDHERHIPAKVKFGRQPFAKGGLAAAAEGVRQAGRFGDELVVHINKREFEEMRQKWGDPHVNPETGLPEFWDIQDAWEDVKDVWNDTKDWVVPVGAAAAGAFLPGIGSTVSSYLPGLGSLLGETGMQALSTGLLGAGAGYLASGGQGAILGGLGGALGAYGGDLMRSGTEGTAGQMLSSLASAATGGTNASGGSGSGGGQGAGMGTGALAPSLLVAALNLAGNALSQNDDAADDAAAANQAAVNQNNKPLPTWENKRRRRVYNPGDVPDYTTQGEREYYDYNGFARGGQVDDVVEHTGHDGRSDHIKAVLSPGEFVFDAETVALLGNGSTEAGAERLDELRRNIRKHKGSALAAGQISPDALPPEQYI